MKTVFMGTPDFAVKVLETLAGAGHEVAAVVSQPDRPKGRGNRQIPTPVKEKALALGLPVLQPENVNEGDFLETLQAIHPQVIVVVAFGQKLSPAILSLPEHGCINVHASLLPNYRGPAPIQWAILAGEERTGVTTMRMDERIDSGDIILKEEVPIAPKETAGSLFEKLADTGAGLCLKTLQALEDGRAACEQQDEAAATYTSMIRKDMGRIDWGKSAAEIERLVRGMSPWPSAYTTINGKTCKIWDADILPGDDSAGVPGTVARVGREEIVVSTGKGMLQIKELQLEGKKRMPCGDFLRGFAVEPGWKLGG